MSWKTFKFFEYEDVKDPETNEPFDKLKELGVTCCSCGRGIMVFGDMSGFLHILSKLTDMLTFQAYVTRIYHIYQLKTRSIILTVGDDEDFPPYIRVWNLDKRDKQGNPACTRHIRASVHKDGIEVTTTSVMAITAHENLNLIAVGFKDGTVLLLRGNITRDRQSRQSIIHRELVSNCYVTGLAFRVGTPPLLMIATNTATYACDIGDRIIETKLGDVGCEFNCCALTDHTQDFKFVVGQPELVQFFTKEGPAQCFGFEGEKQLIRWYRGYLITASLGSRMGVSRHTSASRGGNPQSMTLTIYDIKNQFVAYQTTFPTHIVDVLSEWGSLYVLLKDGRLIRLDELDTKTKLETLFKKNLYHSAISLARSQSYSDGLVEIFTQYGDHLYSKGDFDGAIEQYKRTIGTLEPSYVIRKFLDAQRIHNLTAYLKALHDQGHANADHTTLLLNCYTKLKNVECLDTFVKHGNSFDVEAAIKVCRQASYFEHALTLAERFHEHNWYLVILLEDMKCCEKALAYIETLPFEDAKKNMVKYGRTLVQDAPALTTKLLIRLCTNWSAGLPHHSSPSATGAVAGAPVPMKNCNPELFISVFVDRKQELASFLEEMIERTGRWVPVIGNILLELYLNGSEENRHEKAIKLLKNTNAKFDIDHALLLSRTCNFREGILYLYEKAGLYQQILAYHVEHNDISMVMTTCKKFSKRDPQLWVQALSYFASREDCKAQISEVLQYIEEEHLMQPLMVVKLLAENRFATLSDIKQYIVRHLEEQNEAISKDEALIREYRENTVKVKAEILELETKAKVFQVMKCSQCKRGLTLPAIHFLCSHSFHQHCIEDGFETECFICAKENRKVLDTVQRQEPQSAACLDEQFHSQLQKSPDGFSVVAEYFGRGVFNTVFHKDQRK